MVSLVPEDYITVISIITPVTELSIAPDLNTTLVPNHARPALAKRGLGLDNFTPLTEDEIVDQFDLADCLRSQCNYMAAKELYRRALVRRQAAKGERHSDTITATLLMTEMQMLQNNTTDC